MHKRLRSSTTSTAIVFDFETDGTVDRPPQDQAPVQVAISVLSLDGRSLRELLHEDLLISDQADAIGPFHWGMEHVMENAGCTLPSIEDFPDEQARRNECTRLLKASDVYTEADVAQRRSLSRMVKDRPFRDDRFTIEELRRNGQPMLDVGARIARIARDYNAVALVAHNLRTMDLPHLLRMVSGADRELLRNLRPIDTMLELSPYLAMMRTAFLPPRPPPGRQYNDAYPNELKVVAVGRAANGEVAVRVCRPVRTDDNPLTLEALSRKYVLRFQDLNPGSAADKLLGYDLQHNPSLFSYRVKPGQTRQTGGRLYETLWLGTDMFCEHPVVAHASLASDEWDESIDTCDLQTAPTASFVVSIALKWCKQDEILECYGIENPDAHDGSADVKALCEVLRKGPFCPRTLECHAYKELVEDRYGKIDAGMRVSFDYKGARRSGVFVRWVVMSHRSWGMTLETPSGMRLSYSVANITNLMHEGACM